MGTEVTEFADELDGVGEGMEGARDTLKRLLGFFLHLRDIDIQKLGKGGQGLKEIEKECLVE